MTPRRRRRTIADAARAAGLGEVVRVHREHSDNPVTVVLWTLAGVGAIPAAIASIVLAAEGSTTWQWPLLVWAALAGVACLGVHIGGRHRIVVAEGGLVVWSRSSVRTVPWDEADDLALGSICNLGDVRDSIAQRRAVGAWTRRRTTGLAITGLVAAVAVWFTAVPMALHVFVGERPTDLEHFARMCDGAPSFGRAAPYTEPPPHPVAVYLSEGSGARPDYVARPRPEPDDVQLVGCARLIGNVSQYPLETCSYEGGHEWETYQGHYRVDVYEARTGRQVTSLPLDGAKPDGPCLPSILVVPGEPGGVERLTTEPSEESYRAGLDPLVHG